MHKLQLERAAKQKDESKQPALEATLSFSPFRLLSGIAVVLILAYQIALMDLSCNSNSCEDDCDALDALSISIFDLVSSGNVSSKKYVEAELLDLKGNDVFGRQFVRNMTKHAWDAYVKYAWQSDDLAPFSKTGSNWADLPIGVTIIDSLDTLYMMRLEEEFDLAREFVQKNLTFMRPIEVDFLEITTHCVGGLLSAYELTDDEVFKLKAKELGNRLLPAFDTLTGIPKHKINLKTGNSFSPDGMDMFQYVQLEFIRLSEITGNLNYARSAYDAWTSLDHHTLTVEFVDNVQKLRLFYEEERRELDDMFHESKDALVEDILEEQVSGAANEERVHRVCSAAVILARDAVEDKRATRREKNIELADKLTEMCFSLSETAMTVERSYKLDEGYSLSYDLNEIQKGRADLQKSTFMAKNLKFLYLIFSRDTLHRLNNKSFFNAQGHLIRPRA